MRDQLTDLIVKRLSDTQEDLKKAFFQTHPIKVARHFALDELLPTSIAETIYAQFPQPKQMHLLSSPGKIKLKYSHLREVSPLLQDMNAAIQDPKVVAIIEAITGVAHQVPDTSRFAGGISTLVKGYYINPHLDHSHNVEKKNLYRTMNVLYYVSPQWQDDWGGHYELWDESIHHRIIVPSFFNRLVVMETHQGSWHAVNPVKVNARRCCLFNYYFSEQSPQGVPYFFDRSSFRARPEQTFRRRLERLKNMF